MAKAAKMKDNLVINVIKVNQEIPSGYVSCPDVVQIGWSYDGSSFSEVVSVNPNQDQKLLKNKIHRIRQEVVSRCSGHVAALDSYQMIDFMTTLWPMLNTGSAPADILSCRSIVIYGRQKIGEMKTATPEQVDAYDPSTDPSFPS